MTQIINGQKLCPNFVHLLLNNSIGIFQEIVSDYEQFGKQTIHTLCRRVLEKTGSEGLDWSDCGFNLNNPKDKQYLEEEIERLCNALKYQYWFPDCIKIY